ncbi:addiction module antidote protein [Aquibium microcysteis]|uniref:addiction module antidote protein n=1 Tax=Aquibium microcysteis TaxID=675281 RepID=UPI00165CFAF1|nr:addiction module antidote protein [Aquibium microcysteis]
MPARAEAAASAERKTGEPGHARLLARAFADGSTGEIAHALGIIARARGMTEVARRSGLAREALYRTLSREGDPKLSTLLRVTQALDIRLDVEIGEGGKTGSGLGRIR